MSRARYDCGVATARRCAAAASRGFTLIELLVVLAVIGICVSLIVARAAPDERALAELEAERLAQLLDLAAHEARLTASIVAWSAEERGYRFRRYSEERGWSELRESDALRARVLPEGVEVAGVTLENGATDSRRLVFSPYAPSPVFTIALSTASARYLVVGLPTGEIRIEH